MTLFDAYARERLSSRTIGAVALLITLASGPHSLRGWLATAPLAMVLLIAWRVRDDLASLPYDRVHHPKRALCTTQHHEALWLVWAGSLLSAALACALRLDLWLALACMAITWGLELFYTVRDSARASGMMREERARLLDLIILFKYPALAMLLAAPRALPAEVFALVLGAFCTFELSDDPTMRADDLARFLHPLAGLCWLAAAMMVLTPALPAVWLGAAVGGHFVLLAILLREASGWHSGRRLPPELLFVWTALDLVLLRIV